MRAMRFLLLAILAITPLIAADELKFETASVKVAERCAVRTSVDPGRVSFDGIPLSLVFIEAFKVKLDQITGPSWLDTDCFSIVAKMPQGATRQQLPEMLRSLLAERFKLVFHKETRQRSGYSLVIGKNGVKFKESDLKSPEVAARAGQVRFSAGATAGIKGSMTISSLARLISNRVKAPVQDLTGLEGTYEIDLSWAPDPAFEKAGVFAGPPQPSGPVSEASIPAGKANLFTAIRESLGLRLESQKQQVDIVVIDSIERVPTEN